MVYFSLFAQKRIEVKPGKEILLAVASPDGTLLESPVVFAGKVSGEDDPEPMTSLQPSRVEPPLRMKPSILPPKLRKPWQEIRTAESATHRESLCVHGMAWLNCMVRIEDKSHRTYASVEVQTEPVHVSDAPVRPAVAATAPASAVSNAQADQSGAVSVNVTSSSTTREERPASPPQRARSLSPMELDSQSSTPASSPPPVSVDQAQPATRLKSTSFSPPGLSITVPPEAELPQVEVGSGAEPGAPQTPPTMSPDSDSPPGLSLPPLSTQSGSWSAGLLTNSPSVASSKGHIEESPSTTATLVSSPPIRDDKAGIAVNGAITVGEVDPQSAAAPYVPKRKTVPNPFVRGGVLTDFVGKAPPGKNASQVGRSLRTVRYAHISMYSSCLFRKCQTFDRLRLLRHREWSQYPFPSSRYPRSLLYQCLHHPRRHRRAQNKSLYRHLRQVPRRHPRARHSAGGGIRLRHCHQRPVRK